MILQPIETISHFLIFSADLDIYLDRYNVPDLNKNWKTFDYVLGSISYPKSVHYFWSNHECHIKSYHDLLRMYRNPLQIELCIRQGDKERL